MDHVLSDNSSCCAEPQCPIRELVMVRDGGELNVSGSRQNTSGVWGALF